MEKVFHMGKNGSSETNQRTTSFSKPRDGSGLTQNITKIGKSGKIIYLFRSNYLSDIYTN